MKRKTWTHFYTKESPLEGKAIPSGWFDMDVNGKKSALVQAGYVRDLSEASSVLSKHGAAVRRARKEREENKPKRRDW